MSVCVHILLSPSSSSLSSSLSPLVLLSLSSSSSSPSSWWASTCGVRIVLPTVCHQNTHRLSSVSSFIFCVRDVRLCVSELVVSPFFVLLLKALSQFTLFIADKQATIIFRVQKTVYRSTTLHVILIKVLEEFENELEKIPNKQTIAHIYSWTEGGEKKTFANGLK